MGLSVALLAVKQTYPKLDSVAQRWVNVSLRLRSNTVPGVLVGSSASCVYKALLGQHVDDNDVIKERKITPPALTRRCTA